MTTIETIFLVMFLVGLMGLVWGIGGAFKDDYYISLQTDINNGSYAESHFVIRASNALKAEKEALEICQAKKESDKKNWSIKDIKKI